MATIERGESRAMPQTPCPEVQPPPNVTPIPTRNPPMISIGVSIGTEISSAFSVNNVTTKGPETIPATIAARQDQSVNPDGARNPARIPVAPMIRPSRAIDRTAANPINRPPPSDKNGVNVVSINTFIYCDVFPFNTSLTKKRWTPIQRRETLVQIEIRNPS